MKLPVCIVGANVVGLSAALLLAKRAIPIRLIDALQERRYHGEPTLLFPTSLELFEMLGLSNLVLEKGQRVEHFKFYKNEHKQIDLDFSILKTPFPYICAISAADLEEILIQELIKYDVSLERGVALESLQELQDHLNLTLNFSSGQKETFSCAYLVGCDGATSRVRRLAGIKKEQFGWAEHYLMADVLLNWNEKPNTVAGFQHPKGYVMILPIRANHYRIVCDLKGEKKKIESSPGHFKELLLQRVPAHLDLEDIEWLSQLSFRYTQAQAYRKDRIFLMGHSAHTFSPIGGGAMNSGLGDAFNLCWKLSHVYKKEARSVLLASYSRERRPVMERMLNNTRRLLELASSSKLFHRQLRDIGMFLFNKIGVLKEKATLDLSGLSSHYEKSPILMKKSFLRFKKGLHVGERIKDCWLIHQKTRQKARLFELISYEKHCFILYVKKKKFEKAIEIKKWIDLKYGGVAEALMVSAHEEIKGAPYWLDTLGELAEQYHLGSTFIVGIRPDHFIGCLSSLIEKEVIQNYMEQFLTLYPSP